MTVPVRLFFSQVCATKPSHIQYLMLLCPRYQFSEVPKSCVAGPTYRNVRHQVHMRGGTSIALRPPFLSLQWNSDQKFVDFYKSQQ